MCFSGVIVRLWCMVVVYVENDIVSMLLIALLRVWLGELSHMSNVRLVVVLEISVVELSLSPTDVNRYFRLDAYECITAQLFPAELLQFMMVYSDVY